MQFLWAWISSPETVGVTFSQYSPVRAKRNLRKAVLSKCRFFLRAWAGSVRHSEANAFCSATTQNTMSDKNNFNFLLYSLLHD